MSGTAALPEGLGVSLVSPFKDTVMIKTWLDTEVQVAGLPTRQALLSRYTHIHSRRDKLHDPCTVARDGRRDPSDLSRRYSRNHSAGLSSVTC